MLRMSIFALLLPICFISLKASAKDSTLLIISGAIERPNINNEAHFSRTMLENMPKKTLHTSTLVTDGVKRFDGVLVRDLLEKLGVNKNASQVEASALNDYKISIPLADFYDYDVLLATHMDAVELLSTDKGPLWLVYPRDSQRILQDIRYDYRWVWQLNRLHLR